MTDCPNCGNDHLTNSSNFNERYVTSDVEVTREVTCDDCKTSWFEVFVLSYIEDIESGTAVAEAREGIHETN